MSYVRDKVACTECGLLFDRDLLNKDGECRDCVIDKSMLAELIEDERRENAIPDDPEDSLPEDY